MDLQQTPQPLPTNSTPPPSLPKPHSKLPLLLGILFLSLFILVGSYMVFGTKKPPTPTPKVTQTPPTTIPTIDPTANWQTYVNNKYGYSIKYPQNGQMSATGQANTGPINEWQAVNLKVDSFYLDILSFENKEELSSQDYALNNAPQVTLSNEKNIIVGNKPAYQLDFVDDRGEKQFNTRKTTVVNNGVVIEIIGGTNISGVADFNIYDQILSTFTFLDQKQGSVIWVRKQFGESWNIEYPEGWSVNDAGLIEGSIVLSGTYKNNSYTIYFGYPMSLGYISGRPQDLTLEQWVDHELSFLPASQKDTVQIKDTLVANTPAKKVLNIPEVTYDDGIARKYSNNLNHKVYIWSRGNKNQGTITLKLTSGVFDSQTAEQLLDRFIQGIN